MRFSLCGTKKEYAHGAISQECEKTFAEFTAQVVLQIQMDHVTISKAMKIISESNANGEKQNRRLNKNENFCRAFEIRNG